jgi:outer membrane protein OmpA-like peptidoglycan-associated protein
LRYEALEDDDKLFKLELQKRIEDCEYAKTHTQQVNPTNYYIANLGSKINTSAPEYVPVITNTNDLIFTSKRKDDKKEKVNPMDGKYFESMYVSKNENKNFASPRRYTIPDLYLKSAYKKGHESIVSMSPDGKKLFVYRDSKLYETEMNQNTTEPKKLSKQVNLDYYQNHAYLTKDGTTLFFTSEEAKNSIGGNDIYKVTKKADGTWGEPENLGTTINTKLDEDSPFLSDDEKTLYFASNGHPGYGNYDIYKSSLENGKWSTPINLGKPINSVGHDIFLTNTVDNASGYFSSYRMGGKGDMDIYKVNYEPSLKNKECTTTESSLVSIIVNELNPQELKKEIAMELVESVKNKVLDYEWSIKDYTDLPKQQKFIQQFNNPGNYTINLKVLMWCDTCVEPILACTQIASAFSVHPTDPLPPKGLDLNTVSGELTKEQLLVLGFDITPVYFDFNKSDIRADAAQLLAKNSEVLKKYPMLKLIIVGNTDARASENYNNLLSSNRALAVKKYLVNETIAKNRIIKLEAKGKSQLVNNCIDNACDDSQHQLNRRVEFKVIK